MLSVVTLSAKDNAKLMQQLKSGFKKILVETNYNQKYWYKCQTHI